MKKTLMICALLVATTGAQAQDKKTQSHDQAWVNYNTAALNMELGLNDEQRDKVKDINERFTKRHDAMEAVVPKPTAAEMSTKVVALMDERDAALRKVLNDDQYAKWEKKRHKGTSDLIGTEKEEEMKKD